MTQLRSDHVKAHTALSTAQAQASSILGSSQPSPLLPCTPPPRNRLSTANLQILEGSQCLYLFPVSNFRNLLLY